MDIDVLMNESLDNLKNVYKLNELEIEKLYSYYNLCNMITFETSETIKKDIQFLIDDVKNYFKNK